MKKKKVTIDLSLWTTPAKYAEEKGKPVERQHINNWINRGNIESWHIEELGLTLVKRNSEKFTKKST